MYFVFFNVSQSSGCETSDEKEDLKIQLYNYVAFIKEMRKRLGISLKERKVITMLQNKNFWKTLRVQRKSMRRNADFFIIKN